MADLEKDKRLADKKRDSKRSHNEKQRGLRSEFEREQQKNKDDIKTRLQKQFERRERTQLEKQKAEIKGKMEEELQDYEDEKAVELRTEKIRIEREQADNWDTEKQSFLIQEKKSTKD